MVKNHYHRKKCNCLVITIYAAPMVWCTHICIGQASSGGWHRIGAEGAAGNSGWTEILALEETSPRVYLDYSWRLWGAMPAIIGFSLQIPHIQEETCQEPRRYDGYICIPKLQQLGGLLKMPRSGWFISSQKFWWSDDGTNIHMLIQLFLQSLSYTTPPFHIESYKSLHLLIEV